MVLSMPSPSKHPKTGVYWCRQRVPRSIASIATGKTVTVTISGKSHVLKLGAEIKVSLGTKDPREAKELAKEATAEFDLIWGSFGSAPVRLTHRQCVALSEDIYRFFKETFEDDPEAHIEWAARHERERQLPDLPLEWVESPLTILPHRPVRNLLRLAVEHSLSKRHLTIDEESRERLMVQFDRSFGLVNDLLVRRAGGDYGPDANEGTFPEFVPPEATAAAPEPKAAGMTLTALLQHKAKTQTMRPKTISMYEGVVRQFREFVGHEDARRVTLDDGRRWRDHLIEKGLHKKTINDKYLTGIKGLLGHGADEFDLGSNVFAGLRDKRDDPAPTGSKGYSLEQAKVILQATFRGTSKDLSVPHRRAVFWVPWICAYTGLRVSEVTQLRGSDVRWEGDIPYLFITPDAGGTKGGNAWTTGVHQHLVELGLLAMFKAVGEGPAFYTPYPEGTDLKSLVGHRAKDAAVDVGDWIKSVLEGPIPGDKPSHAWRHAFTTRSRKHRLDKEARDYMLGSRPKVDARETYGDWEPPVINEEINKLARFEVEDTGWRPSVATVAATPMRAVREKSKRVLRRPPPRRTSSE